MGWGRCQLASVVVKGKRKPPRPAWTGREDLTYTGNAQARRLGLSVSSPSACAAVYRQLLRYSSRSRMSAADSAASRLNSRRTMTPVSS